MENSSLKCPSCKSTVFEPDVKCEVCGFPLKGTEKEKAVFIGQKYAKRQKVEDSKKAVNKNRNLLFILGGINILFPLLAFANNPEMLLYAISGFILGVIFIGLGFLAKIQPLLSFIIALVLLLALYTSNYVADSSSLFRGIIIKLIIIGSLIYGLARAIELQKNKS